MSETTHDAKTLQPDPTSGDILHTSARVTTRKERNADPTRIYSVAFWEANGVTARFNPHYEEE